MSVTPCNLVDSLVSKLIDFERIWLSNVSKTSVTYLERIAVSVFGHLRDDRAAVSELAHFSAAPSVKISLFVGVAAIIEQEEFEVCLAFAVVGFGDLNSLLGWLAKVKTDLADTSRIGVSGSLVQLTAMARLTVAY